MRDDPRYQPCDGDAGLTSPGGPHDPRQHAPAAQRNLAPILAVLSRVLPAAGTVLEVASGTGEHAVGFARELTGLIWQPSDIDARMRRSIDAHARAAGLGNIRPAVALDTSDRPWPVTAADAVVCINMVHISPWSATRGLLAGAGALLVRGAPLVIYGPFRRDGRHSAESNARFDQSLRARDPAWGVRDVADVAAEAETQGLSLAEVAEMPANNLTLVLRRAP